MGAPSGEFLPQSASVYIEQEDNHLPELTVRETLGLPPRSARALVTKKVPAPRVRRPLVAAHVARAPCCCASYCLQHKSQVEAGKCEMLLRPIEAGATQGSPHP